MKDEYENILYEMEPDFFSEAIACNNGVLNERDTCMYFGCECGDGWFEPLKKFLKKVEYLNTLLKGYNGVFVCEQLKEKYGELTVYYSVRKYDTDRDFVDTDKIKLIQELFEDSLRTAERDCWNVCEICGSNERIITTKGYIQRICKECEKGKMEG